MGIVISPGIVTFGLVAVSEDEVCIATCDASFKKGAAGLGVTITWRGKQYTPKKVPRRAVGPVHAELLAVERGLREARRLGSSRVLVRSDSKWAVDFSNLDKFAEKPHIRKALDGVWEAAQEFEECVIEWIPREENRSSDQVSKIARKEAERREAERLERKRAGIAEAMGRAQSVEVKRDNGHWFARDASRGQWFEVNLDNMVCGCYWYSRRWSRVPLAGRKKNMVPCKHMAAVAQATNFQFT